LSQGCEGSIEVENVIEGEFVGF
jgi:hypothetical protein